MQIYRDAEWLKERYIDDRMTMAEIAEAAACLPETVFYWLRKHQIPTRSRAEALRKRVSRECEHCGTAIEVKECLVRKGIGRFCSRECNYAHARQLTADEEALHVKAREILNLAVAAGKVQRPGTCAGCGAEGKIQGHHHDYGKPLDVEWLCVKCHNARHKAS